MRKIIFLMHVSLDGFVADPAGNLGWITINEEIQQDAYSLHASTDTAIYGSNTYQLMVDYWPGVLEDPTSTEADLSHARWADRATKVVVSTTRKSLEWRNSLLIHDNVEQEILKLKQQPGKDMWLLGSPMLSKTLMKADLIDEYRLNINPVVLGKGIPLFGELGQEIPLELTESRPFADGVVGLRYVRRGS